MNLKKIRKSIPKFTCKPGCHACCGPVPFSKEEWKRVKDKREPAKALGCAYLGKDGCEIYDERPMMCRLFGVVENLQCPHGGKPAKMMLGRDSYKIIKNLYGGGKGHAYLSGLKELP